MRFQLQPTDVGLLITLAMALLSARLFRLAWRTRQLPELLVAIYFLAAPLGISISIRIHRFDPQHAEALRALNFRVIAAGDSYNDTAMLAAAHVGILFRPPDNVIAEFPQFPVTRSYDELQHAFEEGERRCRE